MVRNGGLATIQLEPSISSSLSPPPLSFYPSSAETSIPTAGARRGLDPFQRCRWGCKSLDPSRGCRCSS
ncbi:unnamed protein product [Arabidopsis lyrata]|uniref:Expressed protein n=1 Tax=Arabidopsis lyrata subsp. lyrata TaxID=81972 RepID=D7LI61_ARALL|nr:expressed protein [Arabidopsis lyrata subsp. lyrata]CAH8265694.1 unnamed protein product [Arabidopsis lyrata]